jgi:hypothetical protein
MSRSAVCTVYDIEANIPELYSKDNDEFTEPIGLILDKIASLSEEVLQQLSTYFGSDLEVSPYLTTPVARRGNSDRNSFLRTPELTTNSTILASYDADTFIIEFSDSTNFTVTGIMSSDVSSGTTLSDSTHSSGLFIIKSTDWKGTFEDGDKFYVGLEFYEAVLRTLVSYKVADALLQGRYVSEAANTMQNLQQTYGSRADTLLRKILIYGEIELKGKKSGYGLPNQSQESWHGYNIDNLGLMQTPPIAGATTSEYTAEDTE